MALGKRKNPAPAGLVVTFRNNLSPGEKGETTTQAPAPSIATPEAQLTHLPGFSHDIAASRAEAMELLKAAGVHDLKLTLLVRKIPMPHFAGAQLLAESWKAIGVETAVDARPIAEWQNIVDQANFDVAQDFTGDFFDDPTIQLTKYISQDFSPINFSGSIDRFLDSQVFATQSGAYALFVGQAVSVDPQKRAQIVRSFEEHALQQASTVPLLWWNRLVAVDSFVKGWSITPSHFIGQDLTDVWLDR